MSDIPSHSCGGDTVFVEGAGCRQACSLHTIATVNNMKLNWRCSQQNGEDYSANSTHVLAEDSCELICLKGYKPHPYEGTVCQHDGNWRNRNDLGCVKTCPEFQKLNGSLVLPADSSTTVTTALANFHRRCFHTDGKYCVEKVTHMCFAPQIRKFNRWGRSFILRGSTAC